MDTILKKFKKNDIVSVKILEIKQDKINRLYSKEQFLKK